MTERDRESGAGSTGASAANGPGSGDDAVANLLASLCSESRTHRCADVPIPDVERIGTLLERLRWLMYPGFHGPRLRDDEELAAHVRSTLEEARRLLESELAAAFRYARASGATGDPHDLTPEEEHACAERALQVTREFIAQLPAIRATLNLDVQAADGGDPAARHTDEIVLSYPGLRALTAHRLAHALYRLAVPLVPRIMSEIAHGETGIDIHPGATIGERFFVDHGTGVVIGETCVIGDGCTVYQGVTLGAKSFPRDETGRVRKGGRRHPTLEDDVTVYAGATILGGDTVIGRGSIIAGGVFLTKSVPPNHVVGAAPVKLRVRSLGGQP